MSRSQLREWHVTVHLDGWGDERVVANYGSSSAAIHGAIARVRSRRDGAERVSVHGPSGRTVWAGAIAGFEGGPWAPVGIPVVTIPRDPTPEERRAAFRVVE